MDNKTAKEILSAYRPNGADALDEKFHEALQHAERDPELKVWFEEQRQLDKQATAAMQVMEVPQEGKEHLLSMLQMEEETPAKSTLLRVWSIGMGIAAIWVLSLFVPALLDKIHNPPTETDEFIVNREHFSMAQLVQHIMPLDQHGNDVQSLTNWLTEHGAPNPLFRTGSLPTGPGQRLQNF